jgi:AhpC/TSA family/Protein of unknown function (DUF3738)
MNFLKYRFLGLMLCLGSSCVWSQNIAPKTSLVIGEKCPDFQITGIKHSTVHSINLQKAKGKWLVLHFFSLGCSTNFGSLTKVDSFQRAFKESVQFVLIGKLSPYVALKGKDIQSQYEAYRRRYGLELPVTYDSGIHISFKANATPYSILIDPAGIVRAKFVLALVKQDDFRRFMQGELRELPGDLSYLEQSLNVKEYEWDQPLLENGNGGAADSYLYRSILVKHNPELLVGNRAIFNSEIGRLLQFVNVSLDDLYMMAYGDTVQRIPMLEQNSYGRLHHRPVWENKQASKYMDNYKNNTLYYSYSMRTPVQLPVRRLQENMQRDLQNYFGFNVKVEKRVMPCWKLVSSASAAAKLATKGGEPYDGDYDYADFTLNNVPVSRLIKYLWAHNQFEPPFVDSTGIVGNVDIHLQVFAFDSLDKIKEALRENGLDLVLSQKDMDVVVIGDPLEGPANNLPDNGHR